MGLKRKQSGQPTGGQFTVGARSETDVRLHAPADPTTAVTVPNPDDPFDVPIFDGPAQDAGKFLVPGSYTAYGIDDPDIAYLLTVPDPGAIDWTTNPDGTRDATVEGVDITVGMLDPGANPDDDTAQRVVVFAAGTPDDAGTFAYNFDFAGWRALGLGVDTVEDSADLAVRALVMAHKQAGTR